MRKTLYLAESEERRMGKGHTLLSEVGIDVDVQDRYDRKCLCIVVLSCLLMLAVAVIIVLGLLVMGVPLFARNADSEKPDYWMSDDPRFGGLIFDEEFNTLNLSRWQHEITLSGGGNWEFEYYNNNRTNSYVKNGILYLKPTLTNNTFTAPNFINSGTINLWGSDPADQCTSNQDYGCSRTGSGANALNAVQSARIRTVNGFRFTYGRIQVRAQLPRGDWLWPAIWMLPAQNYYGEWPASGEIDIVESRGNDKLTSGGPNGADIGSNCAGTTIHWGPYFGSDQFNMTSKKYCLPNNALYSSAFHNWTMDWTPDGINCSVDGHLYFTVETANGYWQKGQFATKYPGSANVWQSGNKDAPFDQDFFFILNVAAGGTNGYFPTGSVSYPTGLSSYTQPWSDGSSTAYGDFWNARNSWYPTWHPFDNNGEGAAMKVDYIRVYEYVSSQ